MVTKASTNIFSFPNIEIKAGLRIGSKKISKSLFGPALPSLPPCLTSGRTSLSINDCPLIPINKVENKR
uniref:Uncharacterized protein n=1 Tax=Romanomermis culicivorax TaxID=13658 RepID=A0A915IWD2_ROMCU